MSLAVSYFNEADIQSRLSIKGVIFDLDGTILNSVDLRVKSWRLAFQTFDINVRDDQIRPMIGLPGERLAGRYYNHPAEIEKAEEEYFTGHLSDASLYPDVSKTVEELKSKGISVVLVTSSRRMLVRKLRLPVQKTVTIDDVAKGKPDTESYLKALAFMGIEAKELIVIGDAETDLIPARKLGAVSVMVLHGRDKSSEYADYYIDEIGELPELIGKIEYLRETA